MERDNKTTIVRVDNTDQYPPLQRAQRLSYVILFLMDSTTINIETAPKQRILEMHTIAVRLKAAETKLNRIGRVIRVFGLNLSLLLTYICW